MVLARAPSARAAEPRSWERGILLHVDGVQAEVALRELRRAVPDAIPVVPKTIKRTGRRDSLKAILSRPARRKVWLRDLGRALRAAKADGAIVIHLGRPGKKGREEWLLIVHGNKPEILVEQQLTVPNETEEERIARWHALLAETAGVQSADSAADTQLLAEENPYSGPNAPKPAPPPEPAPPLADPDAGGGPGTGTEEGSSAWLVASLGYEVAARFFRHHEPTTESTRSYRARGIGSPVARVALFPFVQSEQGLFRNLSIEAAYARSIGLTSRLSVAPDEQSTTDPTPSDPNIDNTFYRFELDLRTRLALGRRWRLVFGVGYARWMYDFDAPADFFNSAEDTGRVATANYHALSPTVGLEHRLGRVTLSGDLRYLHLLSVAKFGQRTPSGWQGGAELQLAGRYAFGRVFRLGASGAFTRFFYELEPIPGRATDEPGDVRDDYFRGTVFGELRF